MRHNTLHELRAILAAIPAEHEEARAVLAAFVLLAAVPADLRRQARQVILTTDNGPLWDLLGDVASGEREATPRAVLEALLAQTVALLREQLSPAGNTPPPAEPSRRSNRPRKKPPGKPRCRRTPPPRTRRSRCRPRRPASCPGPSNRPPGAASGRKPGCIGLCCLDCCCWQREEVRHCTCVACPLWPVRPYQPTKTKREAPRDTDGRDTREGTADAEHSG
jgi:hypothetical protein